MVKLLFQEVPQTTGALLIPGDNPTRNISIDCFYSITGQTKSKIERLQHSLSLLFSDSCSNENTGIANPSLISKGW